LGGVFPPSFKTQWIEGFPPGRAYCAVRTIHWCCGDMLMPEELTKPIADVLQPGIKAQRDFVGGVRR
jgi:hypothetical protein